MKLVNVNGKLKPDVCRGTITFTSTDLNGKSFFAKHFLSNVWSDEFSKPLTKYVENGVILSNGKLINIRNVYGIQVISSSGH